MISPSKITVKNLPQELIFSKSETERFNVQKGYRFALITMYAKTQDASGYNRFYFRDNNSFIYTVYNTNFDVIGEIGGTGVPSGWIIHMEYMKRYQCVIDLESAPNYPNSIQWVNYYIPSYSGVSVSIELYRGLHEIPGHTDDSPIQLPSPQNGIDFGNFYLEKTNYVQEVIDVCGNYGLSLMSDRVGIIDLKKNEEIFNAYYAEHELLSGTIKEAFILPNGERNGETFRVLILFDDGKAVASTNIRLTEWVQTNWWEIKDTNKPIFVKTQEEITDATRQVYDPTLPEHCYTNTNTDTFKDFGGKTFQAFQGLRKFRGAFGNAAIERIPKMSLFGTYSLDNKTKPAVWCTTDGGHNLFNKLDFVIMRPDIEDNINTSVIQDTYSGGLTLNIRKTTLPTAEDKEPAEPYSYVAKSIDAIIKGNETILTVNAHGVGDTAIVAISGTADGFEFMVNNGFSTVNAGSKLYWVKRVDDNNLRLLAYNGSYDNSLSCRHIHKINEFKEGFVVGTGEIYPYGWVYVIAQLHKDYSDEVNAFDNLGVHRLTSTADAVQRTCGVLIDGGQDATVLAGIDHYTIANRTIEIEGRTSGLFKRTAFGVFKIKMSDIDDFTKAECVCPVPEPIINMKQVGNLIIALGQLGGFGISTDGGKSWSYHKRFDRFLRIIGNDGRSIYFSNGLRLSPK